MFLQKIQKNRGIALITTILLMNLILFLSLFFLNFSLTEDKISRNQAQGAKTYYLAETGIAEMILKLKNNATYKTNFETNPAWTTTITRDNPFGPNSGSYTVTITNTSLAHGDIISTGTIDLGQGRTSQRIVKTSVYKAIGSGGSIIGNNGGYADGNINISLSLVNFKNGSSHSNGNFIVNGGSTVNIDTDLNVVNNYLETLSSVNVNGDIYAANMPNGPATPIAMPAVDFDSADSGSLKNKATIIYTQAQFDDLMKDNQNLTLNDPITYVEGDIDIKGAQNLTINGLLVSERDIFVGNKLCRGSRCGNSSITINHATGSPSGIFAKRKIGFDFWTGNINSRGVIYANDQIDILSFPIGYNFEAIGAVVGRKLTITSSWQPINITRDNQIVTDSIGTTTFSSIITVEHWEEEY